MARASPAIEIGLTAAIVAAAEDQPQILVTRGRGEDADALPSGPFDPLEHRTFEVGLRTWVRKQTEITVGHVEQLYTFGDRGRHAAPDDRGPHQVSVGYLALTRLGEEPEHAPARTGAGWQRWYSYFPWEDWRDGRPAMIDALLAPALEAWVTRGTDRKPTNRALGRRDRVALAFGQGNAAWDEERALDRYELLYEAGLVAESLRDGRDGNPEAAGHTGRPMRFDHRRILATAISRLRAKLKYRPVIFELMSDAFTLTELQRMAEALSGRHLHKQNFRRLVDSARVVEPTGAKVRQSRGRPAALFRFRHEILGERLAPGLRLGSGI